MAMPTRLPLWPAIGPTAWPDLPGEMTVTTLAEIDTCPRRWSLARAFYPDLWSGCGHPPSVQPNTLAGTVVHLALETITRRLVRAHCPSLQDTSAIQVLKDLGGYTKIVNDQIDTVLRRLANNPRAQSKLDHVGRSLRARVPDLRLRVQSLLSRLRLPQTTASQCQSLGPRTRGPLTLGVFSEIELHAREMGWKGKADLIVLTEDACEITDFKTGAPDEDHRFQIEVYALLWSRDSELNPSRKLASRLILGYTNGNVEVPGPTASELDALEHRLMVRHDAVRQKMSRPVPEARPGPDNCQFCGVRQLCHEYWTCDTQQRIAEKTADLRFGDVEVTITRRHGPSSWDARVEFSGTAPAGKSAVLRTSSGIDCEFAGGDRVRALGASLAAQSEDETQPLVITLGAYSEIYAVV